VLHIRGSARLGGGGWLFPPHFSSNIGSVDSFHNLNVNPASRILRGSSRARRKYTPPYHGGHRHGPNPGEPGWLARPLPPHADAMARSRRVRELYLPPVKRTLDLGLGSRLYQLRRRRAGELPPTAATAVVEPSQRCGPVNRPGADLCLPRGLQRCPQYHGGEQLGGPDTLYLLLSSVRAPRIGDS
jgi:hypothetical protein